MRTLELKIPPLALVLLSGAAMGFLSTATPSFAWQVFYGQAITFVLGVAGVSVAFMGVVSFRRAQTTVNPTRPQATSSLVSTGIYAFSRNPMYLGFLLMLLAWAVFLANVLTLVPVVAFVAYLNRFQIAPEERALQAIFETEFTAYKKKVRRWA